MSEEVKPSLGEIMRRLDDLTMEVKQMNLNVSQTYLRKDVYDSDSERVTQALQPNDLSNIHGGTDNCGNEERPDGTNDPFGATLHLFKTVCDVVHGLRDSFGIRLVNIFA